MLGPESVSKGCFGFRPKSPPTKKRSKPVVTNPLNFFSKEIWYKGYLDVWSNIEDKLDNVYDSVTEALLKDLLNFITTSERTHQIPTAAILTGINLPDHGVLFGQLIKKIRNDKKVSHSVALIGSSDCSSIKHVVERTVLSLISGMNKVSKEIISNEL